MCLKSACDKPIRSEELEADHGTVRSLMRWTMRLCAVLGVLGVLLVATPAAIWLMPRPIDSFEVLPGDTLIVLGSGTVGGFPDLDTYWRCVYAVRYFRIGAFQRVVLSGGPPRVGEEPVASVMAAFVRNAGIPAEKLLLETSSQNTFENALYARERLKEIPSGRIVLLTSDYHARRAAAAFRRVGLPVHVVAVPYVIKLGNTPTLRPLLLQIVLSEQAKRLWYRYKGWA